MNILGAGSPLLSPVAKTLRIALPQNPGNGCILLHMFQSKYITGSSLQNLAYPGAPASTIVGAPALNGTTFKTNTAGTDYINTALTDTGGDMTIYAVFQNNDTLASGTTQPVLFSNAGTDVAHNGLPANTHGITFHANSTTQMFFNDYQFISGSVSNIHAGSTVPSLTSTTKWFSMTATTNTVSGSINNLALYDNTAGDGVAVSTQQTTGTSGRAWNIAFPFRIGGNCTGSGGVPGAFGLFSLAFIAAFETSATLGGAHTAAQVAQNALAIESLMAPLGITV